LSQECGREMAHAKTGGGARRNAVHFLFVTIHPIPEPGPTMASRL
jgi:hypothetical protein